MEQLCRNYWYPIYAFIRRRGSPPDQAKDFTQDLFCQLLKNHALASVSQSRGRFRNFLRSCAQNVINLHWQRTGAQKRGGGTFTIPLDEALAEARYAKDQSDPLSPDELFERRWALSLLEQATAELRREFDEADRAEQFNALRGFLSGAKQCDESYPEVSERLGIKESAARKAVQRMRQRFGELLRRKVAETVANPAELEDEMHYLLTVLSR